MSEALFTVYVIDGPEGSYVGCTSASVERRFRVHLSNARRAGARRRSDSRFYRALRFYGPDKFLLCVVARFDDVKAARDFEREHLLNLDRLGLPLYNRNSGGAGYEGGPRKARAA